MAEYHRAKKRVEVSVGESVRIIRELQNLSQNELASATGIPQSTISAIERDRVKLGVERERKYWPVPCGSIPRYWCFPAGKLSESLGYCSLLSHENGY